MQWTDDIPRFPPLHCGISVPCMSAKGHSRRKRLGVARGPCPLYLQSGHKCTSTVDAHHGRPQHQQRSTAMQVHEYSSPPAPICTPWNKGKLIGAKPPLWPKHVWSIRTKLHIEGRILELALFNLAIDSK